MRLRELCHIFTYLLSCTCLDEKIDTTLMSVE